MAWFRHEIIEKNSILLLVLTLIVVSIGGLVEIVPLYYLDSTIEKVQGMRSYTPLELAGRDTYVREGCYNCHSQMIRDLRDDVDRYGHYSLAAESMYDHPFQWGSERTGPDLARVGGRYSDAWHVAHLTNPRSVVPESIMPGYPFLRNRPVRLDDIAARLRTNEEVGVPYTRDDIAHAVADAKAQATPDSPDVAGLKSRYHNVQVRDFDGNPKMVSEMDALVAYLQMLGTLVKFQDYHPTGENLR